MIFDANIFIENSGNIKHYSGVQIIGNPSYMELQALDGKILERITRIKILTFDLHKIIITGEKITTSSGTMPEYEVHIWTLSRCSK